MEESVAGEVLYAMEESKFQNPETNEEKELRIQISEISSCLLNFFADICAGFWHLVSGFFSRFPVKYEETPMKHLNRILIVVALCFAVMQVTMAVKLLGWVSGLAYAAGF